MPEESDARIEQLRLYAQAGALALLVWPVTLFAIAYQTVQWVKKHVR